MELPCKFCDSVVTKNCDRSFILDKDPYEIFHSDCDTCNYESGCPDQLCPFCQHLRLRHLLFCDLGVLGDPRGPRGLLGEIRVSVGDFVTFSPKRGCKFCHFILEAIQLYNSRRQRQHGEVSTSSKIELRFFKRSGNTEPSAQLTLGDRDTGFGLRTCSFTNIYALDLTPMSPSRSIHQLAPNSVRGPSTTFDKPATLNDLAQDFANWDIISQWTRKGFQEYAEFDQMEPSSSAPTISHPGIFSTKFRVIDVQKRCLVRGMPDSGFVALSYIWGPEPNPDMWKTTKTSVEELEREGGITRSKTPKTIEDAMFICDKLGQRYLWADRLCIIQDDDATKKHQIKSMHSIFASANFTIAVLDGTVDSGIPGVGFPRHNRQKHHEISGIAFIPELPSALAIINASAWATRGWTYQEAVLSKHILYFSDVQAFHEDKHGIHTEDGFGPYNAYLGTPLRLPAYDTFSIWKQHLSEYTKRKLTNGSDIYDAFSGISSHLYGSADENILYGLPCPVFDMAMLWYPARSTSRRTGAIVRNPKAERYPTWSWGSITGPVCYSMPNVWMGNLVRWIANRKEPGIKGADTLRHLGVSASELRDAKKRVMPIYLAIAWSFGCIEADWPFKPVSESTFKEMECNFWAIIGTPDSLVPKVYELLPAPTKKPLELRESHGNIPEGLATRAQTANFKVKSHEESGHDHEEGRSLDIVNVMGECIGILDSEDPSVQNNLIWTPEGRAEIECMGISLEKRLKIDCLVPGSHSPLSKAKEFPELNLTFRDGSGSFFDPPSIPGGEVPVVSVMAIRWQGPYAYRVSIGWILLTKWVNAERNFHDVILR